MDTILIGEGNEAADKSERINSRSRLACVNCDRFMRSDTVSRSCRSRTDVVQIDHALHSLPKSLIWGIFYRSSRWKNLILRLLMVNQNVFIRDVK